MKITINNQPLEVKEGLTIMEACNAVGIHVPSLCYLKDVSHNASCGVCVVEVKNAKSLLRSCITQVTDGMDITTNSQRVMEARRVNIELMLANHPQDCLGCDRNQNCELQEITFDLGIHERLFVRTKKEVSPKDESSLSLVRDPEKCILCGRCVQQVPLPKKVPSVTCGRR
ncbi:MAG: hydrogenase, Fe-only [Bacteroidetes bacterium]|nr:hydrogenase, Fe-only [Bacteroidota bacterium]